MRYVRFLKTPRIVFKGYLPDHIFCLITLTSDLGDSFLPYDQKVFASLRNANTDDVLSDECGHPCIKESQWTDSMRSLPIKLKVPAPNTSGRDAQQIWPVRVYIGVYPTSKYDRCELWFTGNGSYQDYRGIISAWSAPLYAIEGNHEAEKTVERRFGLGLQGTTRLSILENTGESIARHLWDAGIALSCHIKELLIDKGGIIEKCLAPKHHTIPRNVLELGTGCGMVGIRIAQLMPKTNVILTDLADAEETVRHNMEQVAHGSKILFRELDWEQDIPASLYDMIKPAQLSRTWSKCPHCVRFDLIVAADCTYNPDSSPALVNTIRKLARRSPEVTVAVATKERHPSERVFSHLMRKAGFSSKSRGVKSIPLPGDTELGEETVNLLIYRYIGEKDENVASNEWCFKFSRE